MTKRVTEMKNQFDFEKIISQTIKRFVNKNEKDNFCIDDAIEGLMNVIVHFSAIDTEPTLKPREDQRLRLSRCESLLINALSELHKMDVEDRIKNNK